MNNGGAGERRYLKVATAGNLGIGLIGIGIGLASSSGVILLDGLFNLTYFATGLFTLKVARLVRRSDNERYPFGYASFEPLTNGMKGLLLLGITVMAVLDGITSLLGEGREVSAGIGIVYGVIATLACATLAWITRRGMRETKSPLVAADAKNWVVNAALSSCVLLVFVGISILRGTSAQHLVPYVDPGTVVLMGTLTLFVPIGMIWASVMELLNRAPAPEITREIREGIAATLEELPVQELFVRVIQPGRTRFALAHVVLPADHELEGLPQLDELRHRAQARLAERHPETILDLVFTADRRWGAPEAPGGGGSDT